MAEPLVLKGMGVVPQAPEELPGVVLEVVPEAPEGLLEVVEHQEVQQRVQQEALLEVQQGLVVV